MAIDAPAPTEEQGNPYIPPGPPPLMCEQFQGIDTSASRPGVKDEKLAWCDGFLTIGPLNLRTLPDVGPALWSAPAGTTISFFDFANIGSTAYMLAFTSNGAIWAINTTTAAATQIAPATTIQNPSRTSVGLNQYGSQYVIIVSSQTNGYFLWDGTLFYQASSLAPIVTITNGGSGYTTATCAASGGAGSGATFTVTVTGGVVTDITMTNPGSGYNVGDTPILTITGSHSVLATATVTLMPFGVSGTTVETYSGHVWVANGPVISLTAPGSVSDFATSNGGGNFSSSDSFLRVQYTALLATNGFLYLIGDSSVNYISGVQTAAGPPITTTFTNQNADPEVGTPYPGTVDVFGRNIVFANSFGAHVSYGAAVTKISDELDGVYNTVPNFGGFNPSAAKAIVFGKKLWLLLIPIVDPVTNLQTNKIFIWNGKIWSSTSQGINLLYIQHQEINSIITAWGTDGISVLPMFQIASNAFQKTLQSKLWTVGGYFLQKSGVRVWGLAQYIGVSSAAMNISVDNEFGVSSQTVAFNPTSMVWTTIGGLAMNWTTIGGAPMTWFVGGIAAFATEPVGQQGALLGLTLTTFAADVELISLALQPEIVGYRG